MADVEQTIGVYTPETASFILRAVREMVQATGNGTAGGKEPPRGFGNNAIIAKAPAGGIPARTGTAAGKADDCEVFRIDADDNLVNVLDSEGENATVTIHHIGSAAVTGSAWVQAKRIYGRWVADMEDCG